MSNTKLPVWESGVVYPIYTFYVCVDKVHILKINNFAGSANILCDVNDELVAIKLIRELNMLAMGQHLGVDKHSACTTFSA